MRHEFARRMEREAEELACGFGDTIDGVKPWYSYAGLFDGPTTRVFVGLNPAPEKAPRGVSGHVW